MRRDGTAVRYLGSTIVPDDEACFCQFEADSANDVAEANRRAGVPFDRIVDAVAAPCPRERRNNEESAAACGTCDRDTHDRWTRRRGRWCPLLPVSGGFVCPGVPTDRRAVVPARVSGLQPG